LPIYYTTLKLATYLEEALGNTKYHHQDSVIPNTGFMLVFLEHGSRTNGRDPSIFMIFLEIVSLNYTTLKLVTYLEEAVGNTKYHHKDSKIPITGLMLVLLDHESRKNEDPSIFFNETLPIHYTTLKLAMYPEEAL
jgi:hypothetical protein